MNNKSQKVVLLVILFLFTIRYLNAQSFSYKNYSTQDGLSSSLVYSCMQDSKGYMWFCTDAGVCRFDGRKFELFTRIDGLSDNEVFGLFEDSKGRIWFLTYNGHPSYYYDGKFYNEENTPWLNRMFLSESLTSAFEDRSGRLYFGTFGTQFLVLDKDSVMIYHIPEAYGSFSFFENESGEMYVSSARKRCRIKNNALLPAPLKKERVDVRYIQSKLSNEYYFSEEGLTKINSTSEELVIPAHLLPSLLTITGCIENADSSFLISTRGTGALLFPYTPTHENYKPVKILQDKIILSAYIDHEKNIWFNTEGDGVYLLSASHKNMLSYTPANGLTNGNINRIINDSSGGIWLACGGSTLTQIKGDSVYNYRLNTMVKNKNDRALDLAFDSRHFLWVATDNGISKFKPGTSNFLVPLLHEGRQSHPSGKSVSSDPEGNIIVTYFMGVAKLHRSHNQQNDFFESLSGLEFNARTFTHYFDHTNRLWVANINGLNFWNGNQLICYGDSNKLLKSRIVQIKEIGYTLILATAENGIIFLRGNKIIRQITDKDGLPSVICRKIFIRGNRLWVCTNLGLADILLKNDSVKQIKIFDSADGLVSNDVHDVLDDGVNIYIATDKGLSIFNQSENLNTASPPPVYISKITNDNHVLTTDEDLAGLSYKQNSISVNFTAITFQNPEKIIYAYRLNKNNTDWINTRNSTIEFSNLAPGHYTFSLRAKKTDSSWSTPVSFNFTIHPPFWKTIWFTLLLTLIAFFILIHLQRIYSRRKLKEQLAEINRRELILRERSRISSDMHDDLGSDLSRIVVLSEVIQVTERLNHNTSLNFEKISKYAGDLRGKMDEIIWALNPRYDSLADLISYIHQYALDYFEEHAIACSMTLPEVISDRQVSAAFRRNVFLIVKESLHNIGKHSQATQVGFKIGVTGSELDLTITDNGQGFDKNNRVLFGNGLTNLHKRAGEIGGIVSVVSSPGKGCTIELNCSFKT